MSFIRTAFKRYHWQRRYIPVSLGFGAVGASLISIESNDNQFQYTFFGYKRLKENEHAVSIGPDGKTVYHDGPGRMSLFRSSFYKMEEIAANNDQYIRIMHKDGTIEHKSGPCNVFFDPMHYNSMELYNKIEINSGYAMVVYNKDTATRKVVYGPTQYTLAPNEWLHKFYWYIPEHNDPSNVKLVKFHKLRTVPDQIYIDVHSVRTSDDAVITVHLMVFFHLKNVDKMLDCSHDPSKELMNVIGADVMDFAATQTFDQFKSNISALSGAKNYKQCCKRMNEIGYDVIDIAFRGYSTTDKIQNMHNNSIEERTYLQLQYEKEEQQQALDDLKQNRNHKRDEHQRQAELDQIKHDLLKKETELKSEILQNQTKLKEKLDENEKEFEQKLKFIEEESEIKLNYKRKEIELEIEKEQKKQDLETEYFLKLSKEAGLDVTKYFVSKHQQEQKADKLVKITKDQNSVNHDFFIHHIDQE